MRKILFVHHCSSIGGGSYCLLNILRALDNSIFEPLVLLKDNGPLSEEINKLGIKVHFFKKLTAIPYNKSLFRTSSIVTYFAVLLSLPLFRRIINKSKPEVVYLNSVMLYPYLKVVKACGLKSIIHIREHWPSDEHLYQFRLLRSRVEKYADRIIAINKYSASMVLSSCNRTTIVYDWIDFSNRYVEHNLNDIFGENIMGKRIFLYLGGLNGIKGPLEVLKAFTRIKGDEYRLLVIGINKDNIISGIRGKIKILISKIGWKPYSIKVYDLLTSDARIATYDSLYEVKDIIEKSFCVLSYFTIPHSNLVLAESILLGTPIIAARTHESMEYSNNGKYAILYDFGNFSDFEKKISLFIQQYSMGKDMVASDITTVSKLFDPQRNINELLNVIDNI